MFYNNILLLSFMSRASGSHLLLFNYSKICDYCTQRTLYYHLSFLPIVLIILNKVKYYCQAGGLNTTACLDQSSEVPRFAFGGQYTFRQKLSIHGTVGIVRVQTPVNSESSINCFFLRIVLCLTLGKRAHKQDRCWHILQRRSIWTRQPWQISR